MAKRRSSECDQDIIAIVSDIPQLGFLENDEGEVTEKRGFWRGALTEALGLRFS